MGVFVQTLGRQIRYLINIVRSNKNQIKQQWQHKMVIPMGLKMFGH